MHAYSSRKKTTLAYFSRRRITSTNISSTIFIRATKIFLNLLKIQKSFGKIHIITYYGDCSGSSHLFPKTDKVTDYVIYYALGRSDFKGSLSFLTFRVRGTQQHKKCQRVIAGSNPGNPVMKKSGRLSQSRSSWLKKIDYDVTSNYLELSKCLRDPPKQ